MVQLDPDVFLSSLSKLYDQAGDGGGSVTMSMKRCETETNEWREKGGRGRGVEEPTTTTTKTTSSPTWLGERNDETLSQK